MTSNLNSTPDSTSENNGGVIWHMLEDQSPYEAKWEN